MTSLFSMARRTALALAAAGLCAGAHADPRSADSKTRQPAQTIPGKTVDGQFGGLLNGETDFDKDGYKDLIVGSNTGPDQRGRVQIFRGSRAGLATEAWFNYEGPMDWAQVGTSPVVADVNGDGRPDLVMGAPNWSGAQQYAGAVLVFLGTAQGFASQPSQVIEGPSSNSYFGFVIRKLGDFNGDGKADIAISALGVDGSRGAIYVFTGSAGGLSATPVATLQGAAPWMYMGRVFDAGDIDGDGIADIVVGMTPPLDAGVPAMAWVYKGTREGYAPTRTDTLMAVLPQEGDTFGDTVTMLGDVDGDGFGDVAVGAPMHTGATPTPTGLITVYYGSARGLSASGRTQLLKGDDVPSLVMLGGNVLGQRDMNGDGRPDMLVGPTMYSRPIDETMPWPGSVWVYEAGPTGFSAKPKQIARGQPNSRDELGTSLEAAQVTGSKALDLIAGSSLYSAGNVSHSGVLRIYKGTAPRN